MPYTQPDLKKSVSRRDWLDAIGVHARVIGALMIRDMRTRFGRTHLAYLVAIAWPISHLVIIVLGFTLVNRVLPFGSDSTIYVSTGTLPYILCLYPARMMVLALALNGSTRAFPIVHSLDVVIARLILEGLNAFAVVLLFGLGLFFLDVDPVPQDISSAMTAVYASMAFGLSLGTVGVVLRALLKTPAYGLVIGVLIIMYLSSGVYVPIYPTSETMRTFVGLNPIYHLVQWMRSAYFETHSPIPVDKGYVLMISCFLLACGLFGERLFRGKILAVG